LLRQLAEKASGCCRSQLVGVGAASHSDDHAISIRRVVSHELENVEEDGDRTARKQLQRDEKEEEEKRS
jgi:hypothetical protein